MRLKPQECINRNCRNIMYVPDYLLHQPRRCEPCIKESNKIEDSNS